MLLHNKSSCLVTESSNFRCEDQGALPFRHNFKDPEGKWRYAWFIRVKNVNTVSSPAHVMLISVPISIFEYKFVHRFTMLPTYCPSPGINHILVEGDVALSKKRNAMKCQSNYCKWKKSSNGLVEVPYSLSDYFCKGFGSQQDNFPFTLVKKESSFVRETSENPSSCFNNIKNWYYST